MYVRKAVRTGKNQGDAAVIGWFLPMDVAKPAGIIQWDITMDDQVRAGLISFLEDASKQKAPKIKNNRV